ncbi:hypothetical protein P0D72_10935 [Paraburkholderia sediminicola]|uniref:hypothetical protein n=1 Tax=Paraburkholderia sediminicola TaxID=458836 RepID=UPI0038BB6936
MDEPARTRVFVDVACRSAQRLRTALVGAQNRGILRREIVLAEQRVDEFGEFAEDGRLLVRRHRVNHFQILAMPGERQVRARHHEMVVLHTLHVHKLRMEHGRAPHADGDDAISIARVQAGRFLCGLAGFGRVDQNVNLFASGVAQSG